MFSDTMRQQQHSAKTSSAGSSESSSTIDCEDYQVVDEED